MATNVGGAAYIRLRPDTTGFRSEAQAQLAAILLDAKVKVRPDMTGFRASVRTALAAMPAQSVNVKADTTSLRASVRAALASMPATSVKVKADLSGSAKAQITALETQLSALDGKVVNIRIDLDGAAKALAELAAVTALVNNLDGRTIDIHVNLHGALGILGQLGSGANAVGGRMRALTQAIIIFGSAAGPALAVAAGGAIALAGALTSVVAGAGVGILALSGVVGAVQALNKAQSDQAKSSALAARQDRQGANTADQVRTAIAGVTSAERAYGAAQRDALRAQIEINEAREDAKRSLEDLNSSIKGNDLQIRRSRLDLTDATKALREVENLPVDDRRRVEAQLRYDEARNALDDLTLRQGRLTKEQQTANRVGVEGSKEVVAAQDRARDAQERVTGAAEGVAAAYRAVESAQRAAITAAISSSATAGASLDDLRARMADLSPAGREFSLFLFNLKGPMLDLRREAETGFLPGFQRGLSALLRDLPGFQGFVRRIAETMGDLTERIGKGLTSDRLRPFFTYIDNTASGQLISFGRVLGNTAEGIGNLLAAFVPVQRQMTGGLVDMTARFAEWSRGLQTNKGFQDFVSYVRVQGPVVIDTLGALVGIIVDIGQAAGPVGVVVLAFMRGLGQVIEAIPVSVLTALVASIAALRVAALVAPLISGLSAAITGLTFTAAGARAAAGGLTAALGGPWVLAIAAAVLAIGLLVGANKKAKTSFEDIRQSLTQYRDIFAAGITPSALESANALAAQNAALGDFVDRMRQAGFTTDEMVRALDGEAAAREKIQRYLDAEIDALKATIDGKGQEILLSDEQKAATEERIAALQGQRKAFLESSIAQERANSLTNALAESSERLTLGIRVARDAFNGGSVSVEGYSNAIKALGDIGGGTTEGMIAIAGLADKVSSSNLDASAKTKLFGVALDEIGAATSRNGPQFDALSSTFTTIADSSINATDKVKLLRQALEQLYGAAIDQNEAQENLLRTAQEFSKQVTQNAAGFDLERGKREGNTEAVLANRDALEAALLAARETYVQAIAQGVAVDTAKAAHERNKDEILKGIPATQRSSKAVQDLVAIYGDVPDKKTTKVDVPGLDAAIDKMIEAHAIQVGLSMKPPWTKDQIGTEIQYLRNMINGKAGTVAMFKADGGYISGPGGPRDDMIPAYLSNGEFVQPAHVVQHYGPDFMEDVRQKRLPRDHGRDHMYAVGGLVLPKRGNTSLMPIEIKDNVKVPVSVEESWRQWNAAKVSWQLSQAVSSLAGGLVTAGIDANASPGFPPWPSSPSAQRGDHGIWRSIVALIKSTGPASGSFGNAYRHGDPLWHGSSRAVDWMGYNQDALAQFLAARRPLELIHRTNKGDYAYTRGRNRGSFSQGLMEAHRNHIHVAFADGGLVNCPGCAAKSGQGLVSFDRGGDLLPGVTPAYNGTGDREYVATTRADMANVSLSDETIDKLAARLQTGELGQYTIVRIAQAMSNRPTVLAVDGHELASTVSDNMSGLAMPGIEVR